jgi:hypothetical protein
VSLPLPLRGKSRLTEETKVSSFFWKFCPGRSIRSRPGDPYVHCPGFSSFFQFLHLKEAFHFFPNFTAAGSCVFVFQLFPAPFQEFPKMLAAGKSAASYHLLPTFSKEKEFPNFQQKFTKMLAAGKPFFYQILQQLGNPFIGKRSRKRKMYFYGST